MGDYVLTKDGQIAFKDFSSGAFEKYVYKHEKPILSIIAANEAILTVKTDDGEIVEIDMSKVNYQTSKYVTTRSFKYINMSDETPRPIKFSGVDRGKVIILGFCVTTQIAMAIAEVENISVDIVRVTFNDGRAADTFTATETSIQSTTTNESIPIHTGGAPYYCNHGEMHKIEFTPDYYACGNLCFSSSTLTYRYVENTFIGPIYYNIGDVKFCYKGGKVKSISNHSALVHPTIFSQGKEVINQYYIKMGRMFNTAEIFASHFAIGGRCYWEETMQEMPSIKVTDMRTSFVSNPRQIKIYNQDTFIFGVNEATVLTEFAMQIKSITPHDDVLYTLKFELEGGITKHAFYCHNNKELLFDDGTSEKIYPDNINTDDKYCKYGKYTLVDSSRVRYSSYYSNQIDDKCVYFGESILPTKIYECSGNYMAIVRGSYPVFGEITISGPAKKTKPALH